MKNILDILKLNSEDYPKYISERKKSLKSAASFSALEKGKTRQSGFLDESTYIVAGNTSLVMDDDFVYAILFDKLKANAETLENASSKEIDEIVCKAIQDSVFDYYGIGSISEDARTRVYNEAYKNGSSVSVRNFQGSHNSMCLERACLAHNYFKMLGYDSSVVSASVSINGRKDEHHTYGLVNLSDGRYIYDLVCTKVMDGDMPSPVMCKVEDEDKDLGVYSGEFVSQRGKTIEASYDLTGLTQNSDPVQ